MKAAEKTIEFVQAWVSGSYTKRQYQNYYIVKTPNAQFLMKNTENRELMAIRDLTGHIYLFGDFEEVMRATRLGAGPGAYDSALSNPFLCLILNNFQFKYTCISPSIIIQADTNNNIINNLSKWKTLDRVEVLNASLSAPVYLSLIEIGYSRFYISPYIDNNNRENDKLSLADWASHAVEQQHKFFNNWTNYNINSIYSNKINTVNEIKGNYLTIAGDQVAQSWCNSNNWVFIPTKFDTIEEITGRPFKDAKKTRPSHYSYNIPGGGIVNLTNIYRRYETIDENAQVLKQCINIRKDITSSNWRELLQESFLPEMAADMIAFFEADDAWLREHFEIARAGALEAKIRSKLSLNLSQAVVHVHKEKNLSPLSEYVIYIKMFDQYKINNKFMKLIPAPSLASLVKGVFDVNN